MAAALAMSSAAIADTSQWTIVADSTDAGANGAISSVSCAGTTCWAVGGQSAITAGQQRLPCSGATRATDGSSPPIQAPTSRTA